MPAMISPSTRRLAEPLGRHAEQPGEQDDDGQVGQEQLHFLICHLDLSSSAAPKAQVRDAR
jgi:hypothetical protein